MGEERLARLSCEPGHSESGLQQVTSFLPSQTACPPASLPADLPAVLGCREPVTQLRWLDGQGRMMARVEGVPEELPHAALPSKVGGARRHECAVLLRAQAFCSWLRTRLARTAAQAGQGHVRTLAPTAAPLQALRRVAEQQGARGAWLHDLINLAAAY